MIKGLITGNHFTKETNKENNEESHDSIDSMDYNDTSNGSENESGMILRDLKFHQCVKLSNCREQ